jgi:ABC-type lipoprotein release transport system permease subunit
MILMLAWRNIWRNPVRSLVIIISVAAGLFAAIAVLALYDGMVMSRMRTVIDSETGHLQFHHPEFRQDLDPVFVLSDLERLSAQLEKDPSVKYWTSRVVTTGMIATPYGSAGIQINGINAPREVKVSNLDRKLKAGADSLTKDPGPDLGLVDGRSILIGRKLATKLKLGMGDKVVVMMTDTDANMVSTAMRIKGIYQSNNAPLDELNVYVREQDLAELLGVPGEVHELVVIANSDDSVSAIQNRYSRSFPSLKVESWKDVSPETQLMIDTVDSYSYIIVIIILIALSFGIVNTMMMSVLERRKEIGMMTALGIGGARMMMMVLTETVFLSMVGVPVALGVGWLVVSYYHSHGLDLSGMGEDLMKSFGYDTLIYPSFPVDKLPAIVILVLISAILASIFPSLRSVKINPAQALQK